MKRTIFLLGMLFALLVGTPLASAYIYSYGDTNPYYQRPYYNSYNSYNSYNDYYGSPSYNNYYGGYGGYRSSFYTGGYNGYSRTYGYYYGGDPYWKYTVLDSFLRSSPRR